MSTVTRSIGPMKPMPNHPPERAPLLAFGAHPDDIEFGCGGVVALETRAGRPAHLVVCSRGESATHGTPARADARGRAGRGAPRRDGRVRRARRRRPPGSPRCSRDPAGGRAPAGAAGHRAGAEPGREPAPRPCPPRPPGPRRGPARALRRAGGVARRPVAHDRPTVLLRADARSRTPRRDPGADRRLRAGGRRRLDRRDGRARVADAHPQLS